MSIEVSNINRNFGDHVALRDVNLSITDGSLTALLGPSGGGKSTLLRIIAGLETPEEGTVTIAGRDVTQLAPQDRGIGFVFQHYAAFRHLTVFENIAFGLRIKPRAERRTKKEISDRVRELLSLVQLEGFADRYPSQLSGGQRQRMALARSLAIEPNVLLLDEPFGALDAKVRRELRNWLRHLHDDMHVTTVIVTHDQDEAMEIADSVVILDHGEIQQVGAPSEVYDNPANAFVMGFLGPVNDLDGHLVRPHDVVVETSPIENGEEAIIDRIVQLGFEVRVDVIRADGRRMWAQLSRDEVAMRELAEGQIVWVRAREIRTFPESA
jgi:sulfate transport system ATP-binding protein